LLAAADFPAFAAALGLDAADLGAAWPWGDDPQADSALVATAARTASDTIAASLAETIAERGARALPLVLLASRLAPAQRIDIASRRLRAGGDFAEALRIAGPGARIDGAADMPAFASLLRALAAADAKPGDHEAELQALGLVASRGAAARALERLNGEAGLLQADPRLDMIRLNAALDDKGGRE
jgi:hypothetical protein